MKHAMGHFKGLSSGQTSSWSCSVTAPLGSDTTSAVVVLPTGTSPRYQPLLRTTLCFLKWRLGRSSSRDFSPCFPYKSRSDSRVSFPYKSSPFLCSGFAQISPISGLALRAEQPLPSPLGSHSEIPAHSVLSCD